MATEKRLIDANATIAAFCKDCGNGCDLEGDCCILVDELKKAPTVDAVEVKHGRWIVRAKETLPFNFVAVAECSECHKEMESERSMYISGFSMAMVDEIVRKEAKNMVLGNYCPNCGAKMDGDGNA